MLYIIYMFYFRRPIHHHRHRGKNNTSAVSLGILGALRFQQPWRSHGLWFFFRATRASRKSWRIPSWNPSFFIENLGTTPKIQWSRPSRPCFSDTPKNQTHCWGVLRRAVARKNCGGYAGARSSAFRVSIQEDLILCIYIYYIYIYTCIPCFHSSILASQKFFSSDDGSLWRHTARAAVVKAESLNFAVSQFIWGF